MAQDVEYLHSMCENLGLIPCTEKKIHIPSIVHETLGDNG
jgi:hypothetical protein